MRVEKGHDREDDARHARRGLRRRGQAPHHPRHLRPVAPATTTRTTARRRRCARSSSATSRPPSRSADVLVSPTCAHDAVQARGEARRPAVDVPARTSRPSRRTSRESPRCRCPPALAPEDGLPVGFQILAPAHEDARLYRVGAALEKALVAQWGGPLASLGPRVGGDAMSAATTPRRLRRRDGELRPRLRHRGPRGAQHQDQDVLRLREHVRRRAEHPGVPRMPRPTRVDARGEREGRRVAPSAWASPSAARFASRAASRARTTSTPTWRRTTRSRSTTSRPTTRARSTSSWTTARS